MRIYEADGKYYIKTKGSDPTGGCTGCCFNCSLSGCSSPDSLPNCVVSNALDIYKEVDPLYVDLLRVKKMEDKNGSVPRQ